VTCERNDCPLQAAALIRLEAGEYSEAHYLRIKLVEQMHVIGRLRSRLRDLGVDPDKPYEPHPHNPATDHA
jgi:hypothetical protein